MPSPEALSPSSPRRPAPQASGQPSAKSGHRLVVAPLTKSVPWPAGSGNGCVPTIAAGMKSTGRSTPHPSPATDRHAGHMLLSKSIPDARTVTADTAPDRDRAVDVARLAALVVVMFG